VITTPALQKDIERLIERERADTFATATGVRSTGALACLLLVWGAWYFTGGRDWVVYFGPLSLYALLSGILFAFRRLPFAKSMAPFAVLLDIGVVDAMQLATMPLSPFPAGVAGFSLGIFALLVALNALTMQGSIIYVAAIAATMAQWHLMHAAHVSVAPMIAAAFVLLLEAKVLQVLVYRLRAFVAELAGTEVQRQIQQRRVIEVEESHRTIEAMLETTRRQNQELRELQEYKARLSQLLVHDLRAPLSALTMNVQMMERKLRKQNNAPELLTALDPIRRTGNRLSSMIEDILAISKIEDHQLDLHKATLQVADLLRFVTQELERLRPNAAIPFEVHVPESLELDADEKFLKRVLENLASNAVRFAPATGAIGLSARREGGCIVIAVHNQGTPIEPDLRRRLFERYQQGLSAKDGWGLGLYFCRLAVEAHGGSIAVEDVAGWSTSFVIRLPVAASATAEGALSWARQPDSIPPVTLPPDSRPPDSFAHNSIPPVTLPPNSLAPDSVPPDSFAPEDLGLISLAPDSVAPESRLRDSLAPISLVPDSLVPESRPPDSLAPISLVPDSLVPESRPPDSLAPISQAPDSQAPDSRPPDSLPDDGDSRPGGANLARIH
jgi:signal transduction histidine kinase